MEEGQQSVKRALMLVAGNIVLPDGADDPIRSAHVNSAMRRAGWALRTAEEYDALAEAIKEQARVVGAAAEKAGIDSAPLLLFAADPDERYLEGARAVVERLSVMGPEHVRSERRRIPAKYRTIPMSLTDAAKLQGYTVHRSVKDAVELLSKTIKDGSIAAECQNRQRYVFDKRDFPEASHPEITPKA